MRAWRDAIGLMGVAVAVEIDWTYAKENHEVLAY